MRPGKWYLRPASAPHIPAAPPTAAGIQCVALRGPRAWMTCTRPGGLPGRCASSVPWQRRLDMFCFCPASLPHVPSGADPTLWPRLKHCGNLRFATSWHHCGTLWRKPRLFQRREKCRCILVNGARRLLQQQQGAGCSLVLCWHSFGFAAQKARASSSLEAGFELVAAKTMFCGSGRGVPSALAPQLSVEKSFQPLCRT